MKCRVSRRYGHSEKAALAGEYEVSTYYHVFLDYGYLELIDNDGNEVTKDEEIGKIVAIGFSNFVCPFIRYRTRGLAVALNAKCKCRRYYPLPKRVEGRPQELFVDKTGSLITFNCSHKALWNAKEKINAYQYVQNEPGKVLLNIDAKSKFSISDIDSVRRTFLHFCPGLSAETKFVHYVPRAKSRKFGYLVQELPIKFGK